MKGNVCWGKRLENEGQIVQLVGDENPGPEACPRSKRGESRGDVRGGATARGAMEKSRYVRVVEGEGVRGDDPVKYFLPTGSEVPFESQRG